MQDGWGPWSIQTWFFFFPSLGWVFWEFVAYLCGVTCFQNCTEGESEIWLQKVIWQFIFRAALIPAAFFKLNLWHQDIHHFNCMLLFSQAQICFIFFFLSPMVWGGLFLCVCFFSSPGALCKKPKILPQTKYFSQSRSFQHWDFWVVVVVGFFGVAYLVLNLSEAETLLGLPFPCLFRWHP